MDISEVKEKVCAGKYELKIKRYVRLKKDYVTDENKSVAWNRAEVERINEENFNAYKEAKSAQLDMYQKMKQDIINAYSKQYPNLSLKQLAFLYDKANMNSVVYFAMFDYFEDLADVVNEVISLSEK